MDNDFKKQVLEQLQKQNEQLQSSQDRLIRIETKLDDWDKIKEKVDEARELAKSNETRIAKLEDNQKWLARAIGSAIISGVVAIVLIFIKIGMGIN